MRVATIGSPARHDFWARLVRVRIIAEVPDATSFWAKPVTQQAVVLHVLADAGVQVVVASDVPPSALRRGWRPANDTGYGVYWLYESHADVTRTDVYASTEGR